MFFQDVSDDSDESEESDSDDSDDSDESESDSDDSDDSLGFLFPKDRGIKRDGHENKEVRPKKKFRKLEQTEQKTEDVVVSKNMRKRLNSAIATVRESDNKKPRHGVDIIEVKYRVFGDAYGFQSVRRFTITSLCRDFMSWFINKFSIQIKSVWSEARDKKLGMTYMIADCAVGRCVTLLVIPEKIQVYFSWKQQLSTNEIGTWNRYDCKIKTIIKNFKKKHDKKHLKFVKLTGQNTMNGTSRLNNYDSIGDECICTFRRLHGRITIHMNSNGSKISEFKCVCGNSMEWVADSSNDSVLRHAPRHCQSCKDEWTVSTEDGNTTLCCKSGMSRVHPQCFFVCWKCARNVCKNVNVQSFSFFVVFEG